MRVPLSWPVAPYVAPPLEETDSGRQAVVIPVSMFRAAAEGRLHPDVTALLTSKER
jgi:hypothetical protein